MPEVYQTTNRLSLKPQFLPVGSIAMALVIPTSLKRLVVRIPR